MKNKFLFILAAFGVFGQNASSQMLSKKNDNLNDWPLLSNEPTVKKIKLSTGVSLEYVEQGDEKGIPVIFLHGITDSRHSYDKVLPLLPANIHAFAISQRGHGNSDKPESNYHPADFARDLGAFIEQRKLRKAFVVGHSMSGVIVQQFAIDFPKLTRGVIIIDSDGNMGDNPGLAEFQKEVLGLKGPISRQYMVDFQQSTLANPLDSAYFELVVNEGLKCPTRVFQAALTGLANTNLVDKLKSIDAPVLIFYGDKDTICTIDDQNQLAKNLKRSKLIVYKETGHALHWEKPERFTNDLIDFISAH